MSVEKQKPQQITDQGRQEEVERQRAVSETGLQASGIISIFEQLRDGRIVQMSDEPVFETVHVPKEFLKPEQIKCTKTSDFTPAELYTGFLTREGSTFQTELFFNEHCAHPDNSSDSHPHLTYSTLKASIIHEGRLLIEGKYDTESKKEVSRILENTDINQGKIISTIGDILGAVLGYDSPEQE